MGKYGPLLGTGGGGSMLDKHNSNGEKEPSSIRGLLFPLILIYLITDPL